MRSKDFLAKSRKVIWVTMLTMERQMGMVFIGIMTLVEGLLIATRNFDTTLQMYFLNNVKANPALLGSVFCFTGLLYIVLAFVRSRDFVKYLLLTLNSIAGCALWMIVHSLMCKAGHPGLGQAPIWLVVSCFNLAYTYIGGFLLYGCIRRKTGN